MITVSADYPLPFKGEGQGGGELASSVSSLHRTGKNLYFTSAALSNAKHLHKNLTPTEHKLWQHLRRKNLNGYRFRKQSPLGQYIVDFVCMEKRLVIELDGGHHADNLHHDQKRTTYLEQQGFRIIRFWNRAVNEEIDSVLNTILYHLETDAITASSAPTPALPLKGEGEVTP